MTALNGSKVGADALAWTMMFVNQRKHTWHEVQSRESGND